MVRVTEFIEEMVFYIAELEKIAHEKKFKAALNFFYSASNSDSNGCKLQGNTNGKRNPPVSSVIQAE